MLSFNSRLKQEIARRDAAMRKMKTHVGEVADVATEVCSDLKTDFAPKKLVDGIRAEVNGIKSEYDPKKVVTKNPLSSVMIATAAGFVIVPVLRTILGPAPVQRVQTNSTILPVSSTGSGPQHVVIEVVGAGRLAQEKSASSMREFAMEILAMFGGVQGILSQLMPKTAVKPATAPATQPEAAGEPIKSGTSATISRRYAPPPPES